MKRFVYHKPQNPITGMLPSICVFLAIVLLFFQGISSVSSGTKKRRMENLENAITRSITHCYAVEGAYPESLDYLKENYGLIYDENLFLVNYQITRPDILPEVTITERTE